MDLPTILRLNKKIRQIHKRGYSYRCENYSSFFAHTAAGVLNCANGIKTYVFDTVMPTPVLSFAVRYKSCDAGIALTASHNPKECNGYKVYNNLGCQLSVDEANDVIYCLSTKLMILRLLLLPKRMKQLKTDCLNIWGQTASGCLYLRG